MSSKYGEYTIIKTVSKGGFGQIYLAVKEDDKNKNAYILKALKEDEKTINVNNIKLLQKEIDIIFKLNENIKESERNYIPKLFAYDKKNSDSNELIKFRPYYVIDFISHGNLFYYIKNKKFNLIEKHAKFLFKKIVKAIQFCHNKNICHLDIKPENIVFDKKFNPVIVDFGLSDIIKNENKEMIYYANKGTRGYKCPEIYTKSGYKGVEADIFSLGVVLFSLITRSYGFITSEKSDPYYNHIFYMFDINNKINEEKVELYWDSIKKQITREFSKEFKELYLKMVAFIPSKRPSIEEILNSEWMREINNLNEEEEKKLESEVKDYLTKIYNEIKDLNEEIKIAIKIEENGYKTRSLDDTTKYFYNNLKPRKINIDRITINHYLILNGIFSEVDFMNLLIEKIKKTIKQNIVFEISKESLKLKIIIEKEKNEEDDKDFIMDIELFEIESGKYLLDFKRTQGNIPEYYNYFKEIKKIIKENLI